jgi:hypothetical protein
MPSESSPISGDWGAADGDDFAGTIAGQLGWTSAVTGTGAANTALSAAAATAALLKFSGGVVSVVGTTAAGIAANELLGMTLNNANGMGVDVDCLMAFDTALPTATNTYAFLFGIFDSTGAVTTGNFIGLTFGWNPILAAVNLTWALAADTVANVIHAAALPTAQYYPFPSPTQFALDQPQSLRMRLNTAWNNVRCSVNGVNGPQLYTASAAPQGTAPVALPNIINGWLGFKMFAIAGTANTGKAIVDLVDFALPGRVQFS